MVAFPLLLSLFCTLLLSLRLVVIFTTTTTITTNGGDSYPKTTTIFLTKTFSPPLLPPFSPPEDDNMLLHLASKVIPTVSSNKKIAFMFLTTTPLPFEPLWELFFNQTTNKNLFNIYIHVDPTKTYDPSFSGVFLDKVIHSKPTHRLSPTLCSAARRLLANALLHDPDNYMFALLSPSCIPLHSFGFIYKTLTRSKKSFIEILDKEPGAYDRWAARGKYTMLREVRLEDFRIGSQFWVLTRKHAKIIVGDRKIWDKFNHTCVDKYTCYPEEHYFPTLIHMRDPRGSVPVSLTHVDWRGGSHPWMYKDFEVGPDLIMALRNCTPRYGDDGMLVRKSNGSDAFMGKRRRVVYPFLFARKFSPASIGRLMSIAMEVILKD